jgi:DNA-binding response OmpR family regulator
MEKKAHILVVDDEQYVLELVKRTLEPEGYAVTVAADSNSALAQLTEHMPDLVLLDIRMPGLDGFQVLNLIRKSSDVPVIMLTAIDQASTLRDAINIGADDYITKPFRPLELIARVRAKLRRAKPQ